MTYCDKCGDDLPRGQESPCIECDPMFAEENK